MKRLLMYLYLVLVMSESNPKPKRGWKLFIQRLGFGLDRAVPQRSILETGVDNLPTRAGAQTKSPTKPIGGLLETTPIGDSEPKHKATIEAIPKTLVEREAECAITLQLPNRTTSQGIRAYGNKRYDTPIGRTLTREFLVRDPGHTPPAALRHLPIMDSVRAVYAHRNDGPQPTSPRARGTEKKGRATPKRPRRTHE